MLPRYTNPALPIIFLVLLSSCAHEPLRFYKGPPLPLNQIAVLSSEGGGSSNLREINGVAGPYRLGYSSKWNGSYHVELIPGHYELIANFAKIMNDEVRHATLTLSFVAEAGKRYTIQDRTRLDRGLQVDAWVYNLTDQKTVSLAATSALERQEITNLYWN